MATVPFVLGRTMKIGPYEVRVGMDNRYTVIVSASTTDPNAPGTVPLGFLDDKHRLLFGRRSR